jgi:hypothetical protein
VGSTTGYMEHWVYGQGGALVCSVSITRGYVVFLLLGVCGVSITRGMWCFYYQGVCGVSITRGYVEFLLQGGMWCFYYEVGLGW